ncbi:MAG: DNA polymerase, partial [Oscillospiraceae bacterium]|nr:DNA polymerase [Oscillospiraceae bacterium]
EIWRQAGSEFNINSPKQLGEVLFERLGLPTGKKNHRGWSTSADVLERLRDKHPIVGQVLEYRELTKLKSTYTDGLMKTIGPDGRIHTTFQMTATDTGRLSSRDPNLQNIPIRRQLGSGIRRMFVAGPGNVLVDADYSQIELRILANISGDETMTNAFLSGEDIHAVTASQVFGVPLEQVTSQLRSQAKAVNFGIVYGISAFSLADDIGVSTAEAKIYIDTYMEKYHGVREYMESVIQQGTEQGYVSTLFGRRRYMPELKASNFNVRSFGQRVARNMPIQGTAADIIKLAMIRVYNRLKKELPQAKLLLQVHDELIVECPANMAEQAAVILDEEMENVVHYPVPLTADTGTGASWADAH